MKRLPNRILGYVSDQARLERIQPDSKVQLTGSMANQVCYLLQGEIVLHSPEGTVERFNAKNSRSLLPLSTPDRIPESLHTLETVTLLMFPRELHAGISSLATSEHPQSFRELGLHDYDSRETEIYWEFREAISEGKLELPSLPDIALRIAKAVNDPNTNNEDLSRIIQAEPTVTTRFMSVVNSAALRSRVPIKSLPDAIARLGRHVIHNLVISFALRSMFRTRSEFLRQRMLALWKHACQVAAVCHELGKITPGLSADHALLCGLLHDIGALPIISAARSHPEIEKRPEMLDRIIGHLKGEIGTKVLRHWDFDQTFFDAALHSEEWMIDLDDEPSYLDLVLVAQLHTSIGTTQMQQLPRLDLVPAFHKLALGKLTPRHSIAILENAKESIQELEHLLSGN